MMKRSMFGVLLVVSAVLGFLVSGTAAQSPDEQAILKLLERYEVDLKAKNVSGIMRLYAPDVLAFDAYIPRQYKGAAAYRKAYEGFFAAYPGPISSSFQDFTLKTAGTIAYMHLIETWTVTDAKGKKTTVTFRVTDVWRKIGGKWLIVHEHISYPVDPVSGMADFLSKP